MSVHRIVQLLPARGYQMLLVDERAHGDSEGTYIGFGCLDREDALLWITYAVKRFGSGCRYGFTALPWEHPRFSWQAAEASASGERDCLGLRLYHCLGCICPCTEGPVPSAGLSDPETGQTACAEEGRIRLKQCSASGGSKESEGSHTLYPWGCGYFCSVQNVL